MKKNIIIIGLLVLLIISSGWLIYSMQKVEKAEAKNQNYIEREVNDYLKTLDEVTMKLNKRHVEVIEEHHITLEERDLLLNEFNILGKTLVDLQQVVTVLTDVSEEEVEIGSTLHRLESYCNQVYNTPFSDNENTLDRQSITAWDGALEYINSLDEIELSKEEESSKTNGEDALKEIENATYEHHEKYHFKDYGDFWDQHNPVCEFS